MFSALTRSIQSKPGRTEIQANIFAGLTVGVVALPLSMGLAIASGVAPQHGLYTAVVAGIVIALTGGSKVNISGPTAAFVVILLPIVQQYGIGGLLCAGFLAGCILVGMGLLRLGGLIQIVPYPVTVGFTAGIGVVIATLQVKDFLGLPVTATGNDFIEHVAIMVRALPEANAREAGVGALTLAVILVWMRLRTRFPYHLAGILAGSVAAFLASRYIEGFEVATIGSQFHYELNGVAGSGIPPVLPGFALPWTLPGGDGAPVGLSYALLRNLIGPAFAIAMLAALESLLCAVVADGMSGKRHDPNDELIGQGLGNMIVPFFGGIPATAAIARTAANVRAGATIPLASVVHALFILLSILVLAPLLAYVPMASIAALLLVVAWNMSEARHFARILKVAPGRDIFTLLNCFGMTVLFDMQIAIAVGMGLAAVLFVRRSIELTGVELIEHAHNEHPRSRELPSSVLVYDINGAMFFGSAQKALRALTSVPGDVEAVILEMSDVNMLDMTGMVALESILAHFRKSGIRAVINDLDPALIRKLDKAGIREEAGFLRFTQSMDEAVDAALAG
ncbi:MAG: C4-dicarboxylic acid transporter DauA [Candidatus Hydrogenedentes bacterium]|nr:C4-dicarboxylic acid transporter DauA [Candidatus Hydrogenedentota bacterium]